MMKKRIGDLFESRKGRMDYLLHRDFIDNGIVTFPCKISSFYDIVHPFSVRRYETLNQDFADFLELGASVVPPECPIVVNIIEDCLTDEERMIVKNLISEYYAYKLGLVAAAFLLWLSEGLDEISRELFFVLFWFMGDTICDYILLTGHDLRRDRRAAGQLASVKVTFSKTFDESDYTQSEIDNLYSEIEKDVKGTLK